MQIEIPEEYVWAVFKIHQHCTKTASEFGVHVENSHWMPIAQWLVDNGICEEGNSTDKLARLRMAGDITVDIEERPFPAKPRITVSKPLAWKEAQPLPVYAGSW